MRELSHLPFPDFFQTATGLASQPHEYQVQLATGPSLPDVLAVPTGCGKTAAAVLSWAWRRRECPDTNVRQRTPRRLVYCLPMRSLVDQVYGDAVEWLGNLNWLRRSSGTPYRHDWTRDDVPVFRLMGGEEAAEWESHPERDAVLVGTQDMLLSRALNRGYAMKPYHWPIAFGLINVDALWVVDEVQLMGSGRTTSVQLQEFRCTPPHLPRQSLWMSATVGTALPARVDGPTVGQSPPEWMRTPERGSRRVAVLGLGNVDRRTMSKVLTGAKRLETAGATVEDVSLPERLLSYASQGRFVLVVINRVERAQGLFRRVKVLVDQDAATTELLLLHSRFRRRERTTTMDGLRAAVRIKGRIVISTQVLEAGVDLDADVLVTEICPWPSLVQRLGRLNRRGERDGVVHILDLPVRELGNEQQRKKSEREQELERAWCDAALPYVWSDIEAARERVRRLDGDASISAIERVDREEPYEVPVAGPVLRRHHLDDLFDTDPDLSGGHLDVSRFVRGDQVDLDVLVLWRKLDRVAPGEGPPPHPDELCRVSLGALRDLGRDKPGWLLGLQRSRRRSGAWREVKLGDSGIRPGDTVMLDVSAGGYDDALGWVGTDQSLPSSWVDTVDGCRSWARGDGSVIEDIDDQIQTWADLETDPRSHAKRWMALPLHLAKAESEARRLADALVPGMVDQLAAAGRWHDIGKALQRDGADGPICPFQEMLRDAGHVEPPDPRAGAYYAKSNNPIGRTGSSAGFRHEVASALAYLAEKDAHDLVAWLVMAHHGKVRMTPMPWNDERMDDVAGVRPGDRLPSNAMSFVAHEETIDLDPDLLIPSLTHPGWQGRAVKLLQEHGPQFLAYLEALVRVADWRASR